jgi:putative heme-binding domain-containing protein
MKRTTAILLPLALLAGAGTYSLYSAAGAQEPSPPGRAPGLGKRVPWTTSRLTGSPEPPPPYRSRRVFPKLHFRNPLLLTAASWTKRLFVAEHSGKMYSFPPDPDCKHADLFLDPTRDLIHLKDPKVAGLDTVYGLAFHPKFKQNRYCYLCYVLNGTGPAPLSDGSRVSRFTVTDTDPPRVDPQSEVVLITWLAGGHNGGNLKFGPDGYLYITTGDGSSPNPPDALDTGQDLSDLLSSILRIDVDHKDPGKNYAVPKDNPFLKTPGARPEIWAYGFRNPWQMSFDRATGDLWVGDVGWELWEMVYKVRRGGNYGWPVMEGPQPVKPNGKHGPTPILPPTYAYPHTESASITGGYVYRGRRFPELRGAYVCGDWETRKIWAVREHGKKPATSKELAQTSQRIVAFAEDQAGELYFVDYDLKGGVYELARSEHAPGSHLRFPRRLSETGLFANTPTHRPAPGVLPFSVNAGQWLDYATAERLVALPGTGIIRMYREKTDQPGTTLNVKYHYPKDGVLVRTLSLELERDNPATRRRVETQVLHFDGNAWQAYSYEWNDAQTDAVLVDAAGKDRTLNVKDARAPGGRHRQRWHFPARAECLRCHNPWADYTLAFTLPQLNRGQTYRGAPANQVWALEALGVLKIMPDPDLGGKVPDLPPKLTDPYAASAPLKARARSYLHVNCAHCHQFGAGGTADIELHYDAPLDQTKTLEVRPVQGTFGIEGARILAPADPYRSVLYYRMAKLGSGRMPHIGSEIVDERGLRLIHDWIRRLPVHKDDRARVARLVELDEQTSLRREKEEAPRRLREIAEWIARSHYRTEPNAKDRAQAREDLKREQAEAVKKRAKERVEAIAGLLKGPGPALVLLRALDDNRFTPSVRAQVLASATAAPDPQVRDLFERFLPDERRLKRLGPLINPRQLLALKGDPARGKKLVFSAATQCLNCHRIGDKGSTLGPELTHIGTKLTREKLLENILEPSKEMEPKYVPYVVETQDGKVVTGLVVGRNRKEVVLRTAQDQPVRIPLKEIAQMSASRVSLMPEQQLRDLTAEQAADLLAYLESLK